MLNCEHEVSRRNTVMGKMGNGRSLHIFQRRLTYEHLDQNFKINNLKFVINFKIWEKMSNFKNCKVWYNCQFLKNLAKISILFINFKILENWSNISKFVKNLNKLVKGYKYKILCFLRYFIMYTYNIIIHKFTFTKLTYLY